MKVKVIEGKDLPIMDRASDLTDAFVEVCLNDLFLIDFRFYFHKWLNFVGCSTALEK